MKRFVQELLLASLGAYACLWTVADGFRLTADLWVVFWSCVAAAAALLGLLQLRRGRLAALAVLPVWGLLLWNQWDRIIPGGAVAGSTVITAYSEVFDSVRATYPLMTLTEEEAALCVTVLLSLVGALVSFATAALLHVRRSLLFIALTAVPPVLPLLIMRTPSAASVALLVGVWCVVLLTAGVRRRDHAEGVRIGWQILLPVAVAVGLLATVMNPAVDHHPQFVRVLRARLDAALEGVEYEPPIYPPKVDLPRMGEFDVGPRTFGGGQVLRVKTTIPGPLYLRAWSGKTYTGAEWLPPEAQQNTSVLGFLQLGDTLASNGTVRQRVYVRMMTGGDLLLTPYGISGTYYQKTNTVASSHGIPVGEDALLLEEANPNCAYWMFTYPLTGRSPTELTPVDHAAEAEHARNYLALPAETRQIVSAWLTDCGVNAPENTSVEACWAAALQVQEALADYEYALNVEAPPRGTDLIAWFLDQETGYCVHFATTAAAALRALGIPARYVSGWYVPKTYGEDWAIIRDRHAHAWVELYLDGIGWWPLEVTPASDGSPVASPTPDPAAAAPVTETTPTPTAVPSPTAQREDPGAAATESPAKRQDRLAVQNYTEKEARRWQAVLTVGKTAGIGVLIGLIGAALFGLGVRLVHRMTFYRTDRNRAAHALWRYLCSLYRRGTPPQRAKQLAEKAAFSREGLSEEEYEELLRIARTCAEEAARLRPPSLRRLWRFLRGI